MYNAQSQMQAVTDKRILKSLVKKGYFTFPAQPNYTGCQVDNTVNGKDQPMRFEHYLERYGIKVQFEIRFVDGAIHPFLFMRVPRFELRQQYGYGY